MTETNALIAKFMVPDQIENIRDHGRVVFKKPIDVQTTWFLEELLYHKSWDWLMPVVDKIGELGYNFSISRSYAEVRVTGDSKLGFFETTRSHSNRLRPESKIEATYKVAAEFIKWYNENVL